MCNVENIARKATGCGKQENVEKFKEKRGNRI